MEAASNQAMNRTAFLHLPRISMPAARVTNGLIGDLTRASRPAIEVIFLMRCSDFESRRLRLERGAYPVRTGVGAAAIL